MHVNLVSFLAVVLALVFSDIVFAANPSAAPVGGFLGGVLGGGGEKGGKSTDASSAKGAKTSGDASAAAALTSKASATATATPGGAGKAGKVIPIVVGSTVMNKSLVFTPNDIKAAPGDILQFQFSMLNHTVTQSAFDAPCQPIQQSDTSAAGIHSGFIPVSAGAATVNTFDVPVNNTKPMFIYCAQGPHYQLGMVMAVNGDSNETFSAYKTAAAKATKNVPAELFKGGVLGTIPAAQAVPPPV